ncbi:MAG: CRISPR-associated endoribonuclease Cas6 [Marivirga sp.]
MRVRIIFENKDKGAAVPFHHQYHLYRLFKGIIKKCNDENMESFKHYNFSGLKGQTKVSKNGLHFYSNKITVVFSCSNKAFLDKIIEQIFSFELLKVRNLPIKPLSVELESEIHFEEKMEFICISPIVQLKAEFFDDASKEFIHPCSEQFAHNLKQNLISRFPQFEPYESAIQFTPDRSYVDRIERNGKKYSRIYPLFDQDIPYEVRGYTLPFMLEAPVDLQKLVYNNGIGLYCDKGFGMLDLANVQPGTETVTYFDGQFVN